MSVYFDLFVAFDLKEDIPEGVIQTLTHMINNYAGTAIDFPNHPFFETDAWRDLFGFRPEDMRTFAGDPYVSLRKAYRYNRAPIDGGGEVYRYTFTLRNEIMDDGLDSYFHFFTWLEEYIEDNPFAGYLRPEDDDMSYIAVKNGTLTMGKLTF